MPRCFPTDSKLPCASSRSDGPRTVRLLTVTHFFEDHGGGIERVAGQLCRQLSRMGAEPVWAASDRDPPPPPSAGIAVVPLACRDPLERISGLPMPLPGPRAVMALAREVRRSDAVIVHDALYLTSILAMLLSKASGRRVILVQHIAEIAFSSPVLRLVMKIANALVTRPMLWAADERVFISDTVRHALLGTPPRILCTLLFNGVNGAIFHPDDRSAARADERRTILFVGRYVEKKGLSIIRALAATRPDLTFLMVGSGPVDPRRWGLANVEDLGLQGQEALARLYRSASMLLLPSVGEGYPLVIQEAMACGLPVVCGKPSDRADPEAARWLSGVAIDLADPAGSAERCAAAIDAMALSPEERRAMSSYARQRYSWEMMARGLLDLVNPATALVRG